MPDYNKNPTQPHITASVQHEATPINTALAALVAEAERYAVDATHSVVNVQWKLDALRDAVEQAQGHSPSFQRDAVRLREYGHRFISLAGRLSGQSDEMLAFSEWCMTHPDIEHGCKSPGELAARFAEMQGDKEENTGPISAVKGGEGA